jgi:hypothetical protein
MRIREAILTATADTGALRDRHLSPATADPSCQQIGGGRP